METFYVPMEVEPWPSVADGVTAVMVMRFDQFARNWMTDVYCKKHDGSVNPAPVQVTYTPVDIYGNMAVCRLDATDGFINAWKATQGGKGALADESMISTTRAGLTTRMKNVRTQWKNFLDARNVPVASSEVLRAVNFLKALDFTGHHDGFKVVRDCYVSALADVGFSLADRSRQPHWLKTPFFYEPSETVGPPLKRDVVTAMKAELDAHALTDPCRLMHFAYEYGAISVLVDRPTYPLGF